jgi:hypothetical protein
MDYNNGVKDKTDLYRKYEKYKYYVNWLLIII